MNWQVTLEALLLAIGMLAAFYGVRSAWKAVVKKIQALASAPATVRTQASAPVDKPSPEKPPDVHAWTRELMEELKEQTALLRRIARCESRIAGSFSGQGYDEVDDARAAEMEEENRLMDRYGISREEAQQRIQVNRTYTREGLGLRR